MGRRPLNRMELRAAAEAAEALGLNKTEPRPPKGPPAERTSRPKPPPSARMKVVWAVCDQGGRTVMTFDYPEKATAEAYIAALKAKGKGNHFLRQDKVPMDSGPARGALD